MSSTNYALNLNRHDPISVILRAAHTQPFDIYFRQLVMCFESTFEQNSYITSKFIREHSQRD